MIGEATAVAVLSGAVLFGAVSHPPDFKVDHRRVAGWRLEAKRNLFTGEASCVIRKSRAVYEHGVVTLRFSHTIDTANAVFRVDWGAPRPAGSVAVEAAGLGARFSSPSSTNPSYGEVHIPASDLRGAALVAIQPNGEDRYRTFDLRGLSQALAAAKARGCDLI